MSRFKPWEQWNTLRRLWASLYLIWALDVLLLITAIIGTQVHRDAMEEVGQHTVPSIIHALHIKTALADMDANVANELLGEPGQMQTEVWGYEEKRKEASTALIEAAKNIANDKDEQAPIEAIQLALGTFEALVQRARDLHDRHDAGFVNAYLEAAKVMDGQLLPEADKLDKVNHEELEKIYDHVSSESVSSALFLVLAGGLLLGALAVVQKFLTRRTHRILNPMLIAATLLALVFSFYAFKTLAFERNRLRIAKEDAFTSIHALWRARADGYSANADESRYLLDLPHAKVHEEEFNRKVISLAGVRQGRSFDHILAAVREGKAPDGLTGYLAEELNNITFVGERAAAVDTLARFGDYVSIDYKIRNLQEHGKHAEALELCIGTKELESNWAFDRFDKTLGVVLKINEDAFYKAVTEGLNAVSNFELKASIIAVGIAVLAFFGLLKRIQEYR